MASLIPKEKDFDLRTICDALGGIATKWFKIGIQLGIPRSKLLEFKKEEDPLSAVVDFWLRGNVTESVVPISWNSIATALKSKYVGEPGLAEEINMNYCQPQHYTKAERESAIPSFWKSLAAVFKSGYVEEYGPGGDMNIKYRPQQDIKVKKANDTTSSTKGRQEMDPNVKMNLELILESDVEQVNEKYTTYVNCILVIIKEKGVSPEDLRSFLLSLPAFNTFKGQNLALLSEKKSELEEKKTINEIFDVLSTEFASFMNYNIFQAIMMEYYIPEDREELKYPDHLKAFCLKHIISEFAETNPLPKQKEGSKQLVLKYDIEMTCSLAKVDDLHKFIAKILSLNPSTLQVVNIEEEGCVVVTFLIPAFVANVIFTPDTVFTPQQEEEFRAASVQWMKCNGYTFNFEEEENPASPEKVSIPSVTSQESITACCPEHSGKQMELFCETCMESICLKCVLKGGKHQNHVCEELDEAFENCQAEILSSLEKVKKVLAKLDAHYDEISSQRAAIEADIHSTIMPDARKTELIRQVYHLTQVTMKSLAVTQKEQIEIIQTQLNSHLQSLRETSSDHETLKTKSVAVVQVKKLTASLHRIKLNPIEEAGSITSKLVSESKDAILQCSIERSDIEKLKIKSAAVMQVNKLTSSFQQIDIEEAESQLSESENVVLQGSIERSDGEMLRTKSAAVMQVKKLASSLQQIIEETDPVAFRPVSESDDVVLQGTTERSDGEMVQTESAAEKKLTTSLQLNCNEETDSKLISESGIAVRQGTIERSEGRTMQTGNAAVAQEKKQIKLNPNEETDSQSENVQDTMERSEGKTIETGSAAVAQEKKQIKLNPNKETDSQPENVQDTIERSECKMVQETTQGKEKKLTTSHQRTEINSNEEADSKLISVSENAVLQGTIERSEGRMVQTRSAAVAQEKNQMKLNPNEETVSQPENVQGTIERSDGETVQTEKALETEKKLTASHQQMELNSDDETDCRPISNAVLQGNIGISDCAKLIEESDSKLLSESENVVLQGTTERSDGETVQTESAAVTQEKKLPTTSLKLNPNEETVVSKSENAATIERRAENQQEISFQFTIPGKQQLHEYGEGQRIIESSFSVQEPACKLITPAISGVKRPLQVAVNPHRNEIVVAEDVEKRLTVLSFSGQRLQSFKADRNSDRYDFGGMAVDSEGNIFVVDSIGHKVQRFTAHGQLVSSKTITRCKYFLYPRDVAANASNGRIYVVIGDGITILNSDLSTYSTFGKSGSGQGQFEKPVGIACDSTGNVYVLTEEGDHRVQVFTAEGKFLRVIRPGVEYGGEDRDEQWSPVGIAVDSSGRVYVSTWDHYIDVFTAEGQLIKSFGSYGNEPGQFACPHGLAVDSSGRVLYVCDQGNNRIQLFKI